MGRRRHQQPRVQKTRSRRPEWYVRVRMDVRRMDGDQVVIDRKEERLYLGFVDEIGKREAEKRRDERLSEVVNKPQVSILSQVKFAEVCKVYRKEHLPNLRETTQRTQDQILKRHIEPTFGPMRLCDIDALAIQRWVSSMGVSWKTKQGHLSILKLIWAKAEDWGFTQARFPARKGMISLGVHRTVKGHEMPTMDQLRRLLACLEDPYRAMAEIALYSGMRISEIRGLQWGDIGADSVVIRRRMSQFGGVDVPKSQRGNRVFDERPLAGVFARLKASPASANKIEPLSPARETGHGLPTSRTGQYISDHALGRDGKVPVESRCSRKEPQGSPYIFSSAGSYATCLLKMEAAREQAGITIARFGWHHLRSIFNTLARSSGADAADRQALMGHASEEQNRVYIMQTGDEVRRRGDLMMQVQAAIMGETKGVM